MSRRPRPQYRSGLGWILGVAFPDTLTRPARLAQGFTYIRCCGSPRASSPHGLTAPALASHDGKDCVQLPPARGCYHLAPRRTFTSNPVPMPGTPGRATPSLRPTPMRQRQQTRQDATYRSRKSVQTTGASSHYLHPTPPKPRLFTRRPREPILLAARAVQCNSPCIGAIRSRMTFLPHPVLKSQSARSRQA